MLNISYKLFFFKSPNLFKNVSFSFSSKNFENISQGEKTTFEKVVNEYLNDINKNSTNFQNEFGFLDSLNEKRVHAAKKDSKFHRSFILIWTCLCTGG